MPILERPIGRLGFACVLADGSLSTNHTFRLAAVSEARMAETAHQNLDDLERILFLMAQGPLRLFRLGGSTIPLASHENVRFDWRPLVAGRLRAIGDRYKALGFRFSSHPGPYTILNSPDPVIVRRAVAELEYAVDLLGLMGLDGDHKVIIHGGALYNDRAESTRRLVEKLNSLPDKFRERIVLENDERYFSLAQILAASEATDLPVVFDLHHHQINPGEGDLTELLHRVRAVWKGRPKMHMSSQKPGARVGAHDDLLHEKDLQTMCEVLPFETDVMVESKGKEVAAMHAWNWLCEHDRLLDPSLRGRAYAS